RSLPSRNPERPLIGAERLRGVPAVRDAKALRADPSEEIAPDHPWEHVDETDRWDYSAPPAGRGRPRRRRLALDSEFAAPRGGDPGSSEIRSPAHQGRRDPARDRQSSGARAESGSPDGNRAAA